MLAFNKKKCTQDIDGTVIQKKWNGSQWFLTVAYEVDGQQYTRSEQLTYHVTKIYKLWKIPIGTRASAAIENTEEGARVRVRYNPNKPKQSYLPDNNGRHMG